MSPLPSRYLGFDRLAIMTEFEWLTCNDPRPMLGFLRVSRKGSNRKLELFSVACSRRYQSQLWETTVLQWDERERQAEELQGFTQRHLRRIRCYAELDVSLIAG